MKKSFVSKGLLFTAQVVLMIIATGSNGFDGSGTKDLPYQIKSKADLDALSRDVNSGSSYEGKYFAITEELNLDAAELTPIGTDTSVPFRGHFDGGNKYVTSYTISGAHAYAGLFGCLGRGAVVENLYLGGQVSVAATASSTRVGGVAGYAEGATVVGCRNEGSVSGTSTAGEAYVGGIVGHATETVTERLTNNESVSGEGAEGSYVGGVIGYVDKAVPGRPVVECDNHGSVLSRGAKSYTIAAGIVGYSGADVTNSENTGSVTARFGVSGFAAGIVGFLRENNATIAYATNEGPILSEPTDSIKTMKAQSDFSYAAGIVGYLNGESTTVTAVHNAAPVRAVSAEGIYLYVSGVVGGQENYGTIAGARNGGDVTLTTGDEKRVFAYMAGVVSDAESHCVVINSHNTGTVRAATNSTYSVLVLGGIAGELVTDSVVKNSYNTGDILSESLDPLTYEYIAGIAALIGTNSTVDNCYTLARLAWSKSESYIDLDYIGALVGHSAGTYITHSYWLYSSRYKPVARGACVNCGSFDRAGVMIEDSNTPSYLYQALNERIANKTDYRSWVQGADHPAEFDCSYFSFREDACEAHPHCVLSSDGSKCTYAPCNTFEYATCAAPQCQRCDVEQTCMDKENASATCTDCGSFKDEASCVAAAAATTSTTATGRNSNVSRCQWCAIGGVCLGASFRCKVFRGDGTQSSPYEIATAEDFTTLRMAVAGGVSYAGKYFVQTGDIDFGGASITPIGDETNQFRGSYDGRHFGVRGYTITGTHKFSGLFGYLGYEGAVINLHAYGSVNTSSRDEHAYAGGVVGFAYANVVGCRNYGPVSVTANNGYAYAGGIVGYAEFGAVMKAINFGAVRAETLFADNNGYAYAGGIAGYLVSDFYLDKCFNYGSVLATGLSAYTRLYAGGVAGFISHNNYVMNSLNAGEVRAVADPANANVVHVSAGGLAAECEYKNYVMNFANSGNVSAISDLTADDCYTIAFVGGFFGAIAAYNLVENSYATGNVYAYTSNQNDFDTSAIGGIVGYTSYGSYIRNCYFSGDVVLDTYLSNYYSYAGALFGYSTYDSVDSCYWRFDPELDSFGTGACSNCASFNKYDIIAKDSPDPTYLYEVLNAYLDPAANHSSSVPAQDFKHWVQGRDATPAGFECSNFDASADFCASLNYCVWSANESACKYRPCADFSYESCNAPQCRGCDFSRVCIDANDTKTTCISCSTNVDKASCNAIPVCHWCQITGGCLSDINKCAEFVGNGTAEAPYELHSDYDLRTLQLNVNAGVNYAGKYFVMTNSLDLKNVEVEPIGTASNPFRGHFDGNGHIVSGYTITCATHAYVGFFGYLGKGAVVRNFRVRAYTNVSSFHYDVFAGGIAGYAYQATVTGCHNYGNINSYSDTGYAYSGGVVGYSEEANITNCYNSGRITAVGISTDCYSGGVVGYSASPHPVDHCFNLGDVSTDIRSRYQSSHIGGVVGSANIVTNSFNRGSLFVQASHDSFTYNGGVVGFLPSFAAARNCFNEGLIFVLTNASYTYSCTGGVVGAAYGATVDNCFASGTIVDKSASAYIGAVLGRTYHENNITRCYWLAGITPASTPTGTNGTCTNCSEFDANGNLLRSGGGALYAALNASVTAENGYVPWVAPPTPAATPKRHVATFDCSFFTSVTNDACEAAGYCSWCFIEGVCAASNASCAKCSDRKSRGACYVYNTKCSWCEDEGVCHVLDSSCTVCKTLANNTCAGNAYCRFCEAVGCIRKNATCASDKPSGGNATRLQVIIALSAVGVVVFLIILLLVFIIIARIRNGPSSGAGTYKNLTDDNSFGGGGGDTDGPHARNAPLLINDEVGNAPRIPAYIAVSAAALADRSVKPEITANAICSAAAVSTAPAANLNAALREAGFEESQVATLMAASLDKAAAAASGAGSSLSQEEAMALALLTFDFGASAGMDENPLTVINNALREGSEQSVAPVRSLVTIVVGALHKVVPIAGATLYFGVQGQVSYDRNTVLYWPDILCASTSMDAVKNALSEDGKPKGTIVTINNARGYNLHDFSFFPNDSEVFFEPGAQFNVVDVSTSIDLNIINLNMTN